MTSSTDALSLLKDASPTAVLVIVVFITVLRNLPLLRDTIADILPQSRQLARLKRAADIIKAQSTIVQFAKKQDIKLPEETDDLMTELIRQTLTSVIRLKKEGTSAGRTIDTQRPQTQDGPARPGDPGEGEQSIAPSYGIKPTETPPGLRSGVRFAYGALGALLSQIGAFASVDLAMMGDLNLFILIGLATRILTLVILGGVSASFARTDSRMTAFIVGVAGPALISAYLSGIHTSTGVPQPINSG